MKSTDPKPIIVMPLATPAAAVRELKKAGYIPVLTDEPAKVMIITPAVRVSGDDFLMAALAGLEGGLKGYNGVNVFFRELHSRATAREKGGSNG